MSNKYLEVTNLKKSFGGLKAVDVQSLNLNKNELTSIIGPNGAGKTTFFDLISGFQDSDEGKVYLNKKNITKSQPYSCLLYTSPSPRDGLLSRMPSSA